LLKGLAAEAISGLVEINYEGAVALLMKCFGDKKQIIAKQMDILINLEGVVPSITSRHSTTYMTQLRWGFEKALGIESDSYGSL